LEKISRREKGIPEGRRLSSGSGVSQRLQGAIRLYFQIMR
jgi:hypothetical protein